MSSRAKNERKGGKGFWNPTGAGPEINALKATKTFDMPRPLLIVSTATDPGNRELMNVRAWKQGEIALASKPSLQESRDPARAREDSYWAKLIPRSPIQVCFLAVVILVISLHLQYLLDVRTPIPHLDDWNLLEKMFRSSDIHRIPAWVFDSTNGHFLVPAALGFLVSWRYLGLDFTSLKLLNFPICLLAFFLVAHVINREIRSRFLRFYLYAGASFVVFSLCFWEHFALGSGFAAILSTLFGGIGLCYLSKAAQPGARWKGNLLAGLLFLLGAVLSLGAGYAAVAAAISLFVVVALKRFLAARPVKHHEAIAYYICVALGLLALLSHPFFQLKSRILRTFFHSVLVMGSAGSAFLDRNTVVAQNVAFLGGMGLVIAVLWIGLHFWRRPASDSRLLPIFSLALVLFGISGCMAVAVGRSYLPPAEFLNSRYTLYPSLCLLGALLYFAGSRLFLLTNVWCLIAAAYVLATVREHQISFYRAQVYRTIEASIRASDTLPDEQLRLALRWRENTKGVRKVTARLRKDRLNVFRSDNQNNVPR